jgi:hypothetical protein
MCIVYHGECENLLTVHISWGLCMFTECRRVGLNVHATRVALQRVSQKLDYRIDICRVTKGAHIEHL